MHAEFIEMLRRTGDARFDGLPDVLENTAPEVSVRLNPRKQMCLPTDGMDAEKMYLPADAVEAGRVPWWPEARSKASLWAHSNTPFRACQEHY